MFLKNEGAYEQFAEGECPYCRARVKLALNQGAIDYKSLYDALWNHLREAMLYGKENGERYRIARGKMASIGIDLNKIVSDAKEAQEDIG